MTANKRKGQKMVIILLLVVGLCWVAADQCHEYNKSKISNQQKKPCARHTSEEKTYLGADDDMGKVAFNIAKDSHNGAQHYLDGYKAEKTYHTTTLNGKDYETVSWSEEATESIYYKTFEE